MTTKTLEIPGIIAEAKAAGCENADQITGYLAGDVSRLRSLLQQMLDVAENADETGYVPDVGFVDLDKLHAEVRGALENAVVSHTGALPDPKSTNQAPRPGVGL